MHAAATAKHAAETNKGRRTWIESMNPVKMGATIPARRLRAEAIPVAVPLEKMGRREFRRESKREESKETNRIAGEKTSGV